MLLDITEVIQTRGVSRVSLKSLFEVFSGFIEATETAVRKPQERIGARRRIQADQRRELLDRFFDLAGHEIAFAQCRVQIDSVGCNFQSGFQQRNGVLIIVLGHAGTRQQKNDVRIFGCKLVCTQKNIQGIDRLAFIRIGLSEQEERVGRIRLEFQRAIQNGFGFCVLRVSKIDLAEIVQDLESLRLQGIGLLQFQLRGTELFFRSQEYAQGEMYLQVVLVLCGKLLRGLQSRRRASGREISSRQIETRGNVLRMDTLQVRQSFQRLFLRQK